MFSLRVFSAVISTATMFFGYLTLKRLFGDPRLVQASALLITLLPMYAYMGMAVNPDILTWLIFSVFLYLAVKALDEGLSPGMNVGIAATLVAGVWIKQTFLIALPIYGILLVFLILKRSSGWREVAQHLTVVLTAMALFAGPLYVSGSVLTSTDYPGGISQERSIGGFIDHFAIRRAEYWRTFDSFWGLFGWLDTPLSSRIYDMLRLGTFVAGVGLAFHLISTTARRSYDMKALFLVAVSVMYIAAYVVLNYLRITSGEEWLLQGRYFFMIIVPIMALLLKGAVWYVPGGRYRDALLLAVVAGTMLFHAEALFRYVLPRYYL